jgi:hypothetical protein
MKAAGQRIRLTTSLPSVSWLSRNFGSLDISQPYGLPQPLTGMALMLYFFMISSTNMLVKQIYEVEAVLALLLIYWYGNRGIWKNMLCLLMQFCFICCRTMNWN